MKAISHVSLGAAAAAATAAAAAQLFTSLQQRVISKETAQPRSTFPAKAFRQGAPVGAAAATAAAAAGRPFCQFVQAKKQQQKYAGQSWLKTMLQNLAAGLK